MHTISIFVDQNRMPKLASYFECQTHLAKNLRNSANFILRNNISSSYKRRSHWFAGYLH